MLLGKHLSLLHLKFSFNSIVINCFTSQEDKKKDVPDVPRLSAAVKVTDALCRNGRKMSCLQVHFSICVTSFPQKYFEALFTSMIRFSPNLLGNISQNFPNPNVIFHKP